MGLNPLAEREPLPRLGPVRLSNADDVPHELSVRIRRAGEQVYAETFELETDGEEGTFGGLATVECGPGSERGRYTLSFETETGESADIELERGDGPALSVLAEIRGGGEVGIFSGANSYGNMCDAPTPTPE
jgi:hypothetical protein